MASDPLLEIRGVSVSFGGVHALKEVSFSVEKGSITALIGPNGAGKTTMFNVISGFHRPKAGAVYLEGADITRTPTDRRAGLGMARTFQNIALYPGMTVLENIKLGAHAHLKTSVLSAGWFWGSARAEEVALRAKIEEEIIDFLEIDHIRNHFVSALPYGLLKRVELARALALDQPARRRAADQRDRAQHPRGAGLVLHPRAARLPPAHRHHRR